MITYKVVLENSVCSNLHDAKTEFAREIIVQEVEQTSGNYQPHQPAVALYGNKTLTSP